MSGFTLYLAKSNVSDIIDFLSDLTGVDNKVLEFDDKVVGDLFVVRRDEKLPRWAKYFRGSSVSPREVGRTRSAGAALLMEVEDRIMAVTFGTGYHLINKELAEERFGLLVVLNSIAPGRLRSLDKDSFDAISKKSREQSIREAEAYEFGIDTEQDLLRGVTGVPSDESLGKSLTGKESLHVSGPLDLRTLPELLPRYLEKYNDTKYRDEFSWVDNIQSIKKQELRNDLDAELERKLVSEEWQSIWLAAPDIIDWARLAGFQYKFGRAAPVIYDMHLDTASGFINGELSVRRLRQKRVSGLDINDVEIDSWSLYKCIHAEIELDGFVYLLSDGKWYQANRDFVSEVDLAISTIDVIDASELGLPPFGENDEKLEREYNERVARTSDDRYALMDRALLNYGGGRSKVEVCDLYSASHDFVHVKRYAGSSDLSHLFSQGLISGESFARDPGFRERVFAGLPYAMEDDGRFLRRDRYRVVFAVISRSGRSLKLPFSPCVSVVVASNGSRSVPRSDPGPSGPGSSQRRAARAGAAGERSEPEAPARAALGDGSIPENPVGGEQRTAR